jgi:hypothetical protein
MIDQPYVYRRLELAEPNLRRFPAGLSRLGFPGWADVTAADWNPPGRRGARNALSASSG